MPDSQPFRLPSLKARFHLHSHRLDAKLHRVYRISTLCGLGAILLLSPGCSRRPNSAPGSVHPQAQAQHDAAPGTASAPTASDLQNKFEQDRASILSMVGSFEVVFDFRETVPLASHYKLAAPKKTGATELVVLVEDRGHLIRLQHLLVVGGSTPMVIKHWRQDWRYEPQRQLRFIGGNAWESVEVPAEQRRGAWSQTVYQVDDTPRYAAVGRWDYTHKISQWSPKPQWRPLPRRDMTTRNDYHVLECVNRHVLTPYGWAHEQDNTKIVLREPQYALVREVGINSYRRNDSLDLRIARDYWEKTRSFWQQIRNTWDQIESEHPQFAITIAGETSALYMPILGLADKVAKNELSSSQAALQAIELIRKHLVYKVPELSKRLRPGDS